MGKLIQHWSFFYDRDEPQQCVGNDYSRDEMWSDIRHATLSRDGGVLVIGLYSKDERREEVREFLERSGDVDLSRVGYFVLPPLTRTIHVRAREAYKSEYTEPKTGKLVVQDIPARPAGTVTRTFDKRFHFGDRRNLELLIATVRESTSVRSIVKSYCDREADFPISVIVMCQPNVDEGHLDYLEEFRAACPQVDIYIFHGLDYTKYGVKITGDAENWENEFPTMGECELPLPEVIVDDLLLKGCIHVWAGMFESYKTMAGIELSSAILEGRKALDEFQVRKQYPILSLNRDMDPALFQDYARPFGLLKQEEFRWERPGAEMLHALDSRVLEKAVKGRILILDTMLDFASITEAFQSKEWIEFFSKLRRLISVCGCVAIVMLVHPTKTGAKSNLINPSEYLKDSVTFGGKIDLGYGFRKIENTFQILIERIKGRGFKKGLQFTITVNDELGNSYLDKGRFPVCQKPGQVKREKQSTGRPPKGDAYIHQQILDFKSQGKSNREIADLVNLSEKTIRRRLQAAEFDSNERKTI